MASSSGRSLKRKMRNLHLKLLTEISDNLHEKERECQNLFEFIKDYVGKGVFSSKSSIIEKLRTLETKRVIECGKYDQLKQMCTISGNNYLVDIIEKYEDKMQNIQSSYIEDGKTEQCSLYKRKHSTSSDAPDFTDLPLRQSTSQCESVVMEADLGSYKKRKHSGISPMLQTTEIQQRPSTSTNDYHQMEATENALQVVMEADLGSCKKRKHSGISSTLQTTEIQQRPSTSTNDYHQMEATENALQGVRNNGYENWLKALLMLNHVRKVLIPFCREVINHQHETLLLTVQQQYKINIKTCNDCRISTLRPFHIQTVEKKCPLGCRRCNCLRPNKTFACPNNICSALYDEIVKLHVRRSPIWGKVDISKWCEDPWEVAKCFSFYPSNSLNETDFSGMLHIIHNSTTFFGRVTRMEPFYKAIEARNNLIHCATSELSDTELDSYVDTMMDLLNLPELKNMPGNSKAMTLCKEIKNCCGETIFPCNEKNLNSQLNFIMNELVDENIRVMVLRSESDGHCKSPLITRLLGQVLESKQPTGEIDVYQCIVKPNGEWEVTRDGEFTNSGIEIWDVEGSLVNYATHQVFLCKYAIYLIVFNLMKGLDATIGNKCKFGKHSTKTVKDIISHWVNSIHTFVGTSDGSSPPIILVAFQSNGVQYDSETLFHDITKNFCKTSALNHVHQKVFAISNTSLESTNISELQSLILHLGGFRADRKKKKIQAKWKELAYEIKNQNKVNKIITVDALKIQIDKINTQKWNGKFRMETKEVKDFLVYQHERGEFCYFHDVPKLADYVITDPMLLVEAFRLITLAGDKCRKYPMNKKWNQLNDIAILHQDIVNEAWRENFTEDRNDLLLEFFKEYHIIAYLQCNSSSALKSFLIPSFLKSSAKSQIKRYAMYAFMEGKRCSEVSVRYECIPKKALTVLFSRILAALVSKWPVSNFRNDLLIFDNLVVCEPRPDHACLLFQVKNGIELLTVNLVQGEVLTTVCDMYRVFVERIITEHIRTLCFCKDLQENEYLKVAYRCRHPVHGNKGSRQKLRHFKMISKDHPCPDHENHNIKPVFLEKWFSSNEIKKLVNNQTQRLTVEQYNELALFISGNFQNLSSELGINEDILGLIEDNYISQKDKIFHLLLAWDKKFGENATFSDLKGILMRTSGIEVNWDEIQNIRISS